MKLTIEKVVYGGQGMARMPEDAGAQGGMRVFVPFTLPGEVVETEITEQHRGYCAGEARRIEQASEFRATPPCPWFGHCGGCQLQHSAYSFQVEMKRAMLAESLTRAGVRDLPAITTLAGRPLGYRNRVRLQVETRHEFSIGYRLAKSHRMAAIEHCPIAVPLLERTIRALRGLGVERTLPANMAEVELFTNHDQGELLLTMFVAQRESKGVAEFFLRLQEAIPELTGALVLLEEKQHSPGTRPLLEWGRQSLAYRVAGREYTIGIRSFFQINASLLDAFVDSVVDEQGGACAWDLYAGGGFFSLPLAERFERIVAVESSASSGKDLRQNLRGTRGIAVNSTVIEFLKKAAGSIVRGEEPAPDLVLLDPPRAGAGVEACRLVAAANPRRVVYVSCDPATLGRDLAALIQSGYRLERLQLVDMFPQTSHLETIAVLDR